MTVALPHRIGVWPTVPFQPTTTATVMRSRAGEAITLHVGRWFAEPSAAEHDVLALALAPVLDIGCGPARHTLALEARESRRSDSTCRRGPYEPRGIGERPWLRATCST
jgi:hypothetical protein